MSILGSSKQKQAIIALYTYNNEKFTGPQKTLDYITWDPRIAHSSETHFYFCVWQTWRDAGGVAVPNVVGRRSITIPQRSLLVEWST